MAAVYGSVFGIIGEWATVGLLSDNMFDLLFLKSTEPNCHSVMLYHRLVFPPTMCAKVAYFLCPSEEYVHSSPLYLQFLWVQKYFGVCGVDDCPRPRLFPLLAPHPHLRPRTRPKLFP